MSYRVLARRYRPQTFKEIVRQDHISITLSNAIRSDRIAHAILFSGPRGTGKTSAARILAKSLNCEKGPSPSPCSGDPKSSSSSCSSCMEIVSGNALDVFEIDGASHTGVDNVRELRENARYRPARSPFKIYIIDEVHMLSSGAFNALLKILEEPPNHLIFIFATTEPRKIPATILSRCQRHDFRRIDAESLAGHMRYISDQEGFEISGESLDLMAREAKGSMRDALTLLDQAFTGAVEKKIDHDQLVDMFGILDRKAVFGISDALFSQTMPEALSILDEVYEKGYEMGGIFADIMGHFRNMIVVKMGKRINELLDIPSYEIKQIQERVKDIPASWLTQALDILSGEETAVRLSTWPKLSIEIAFFKVAGIKPALSMDRLIEKIDDLKNHMFSSLPGGASAIAAAPGGGLETKDRMTARIQPPVEISSEKRPSEKRPADEPRASESNFKADHGVAESQSEFLREPPRGGAMHDSEFSPEAAWAKLVKASAAKSPYLGAILSKSALSKLTKDSLEIEADGGKIAAETLLRKKNMDILRQACADFFGGEMTVSVKASEGGKTLAQKRDDVNHLKKEALSHPLVEEAVRAFNAKITDIKITREAD